MSILFLKNNQIIFLKQFRLKERHPDSVLHTAKEGSWKKDPHHIKESVSPAGAFPAQLVFQAEKRHLLPRGRKMIRIS